MTGHCDDDHDQVVPEPATRFEDLKGHCWDCLYEERYKNEAPCRNCTFYNRRAMWTPKNANK